MYLGNFLLLLDTFYGWQIHLHRTFLISNGRSNWKILALLDNRFTLIGASISLRSLKDPIYFKLNRGMNWCDVISNKIRPNKAWNSFWKSLHMMVNTFKLPLPWQLNGSGVFCLFEYTFKNLMTSVLYRPFWKQQVWVRHMEAVVFFKNRL